MSAPRLRLTPAQRSNFVPLTALGYAWWRARSLSLLSGQRFGLAREAALFVSLCRPQPGQRWLDAGTSTGFYAGVLAAHGCEVVAADLSADMLAQGQRRERSPLIEWQQVNLEVSGWPDAAFDGVAVGATLNETARPDVFLHEMARLLRPGAPLWLMYAAPSGGFVQRLLGKLGSLTFPDLAWVERQLHGLTLEHAYRVSGVQFALFRKA